MRKILFSFLAIGALASCAKTEAIYTEDNSEIRIAPVTSMSTKAQYGVIDGTTYPTAENFNVYAYWANEPAGSHFNTGATVYLDNVKFINKGRFWGGETTYYWPKNGSLRFSAYSPADLNMIHDLEQDTYLMENFTYVDDFSGSYDILVAPTTESYTAKTAAEKVSVVFQHALSWLSFNVTSTAVANGTFTVHDVIINDVAVKGSLRAEMPKASKEWTVDPASAKSISVYNGNTNVTTAVTPVNDHDNLVLPQGTTTVTVNFTQNAMEGTPALENQTVTIPLTLDADKPWEAGKHYTYTIIFDLDEILINPSVEDWEEVSVPTIDATATEVANQEELQAAVAAGRSVRLIDNINLTAPIVVANSVVTKAAGPVSVVIDLNGKNIIAESTDAIVVDNGASLEINGDGKVWAATNNTSSANAVWVKHGNVTINGGDYYVGKDNTTRNDCIYIGAAAYVADAATKVSTVTINGGRFEAAAMEYNQYWVLNIKDEFTSSRFYVKGGEFVNFDPSNNVSEGDGTNFLVDGYASYELKAGVWTVVNKETKTVVNSEAALADAAAQGGNVVLGADIQLSKLIVVSNELVLDLNGKTITAPVNNGNSYAIAVYPEGNLTIDGEGKVLTQNATYSIAVWAYGGTATINGGYYENAGDGCELIYASNAGKVFVNGGTFKATERIGNEDSTLNKYTALNLQDNSGSSISVTGGSFYAFDPSNNLSEGANTNFVAEGYKAVANGDWFTVMAE